MDPKDKPATWLVSDVEQLMEGLNEILRRLLDTERRLRRLEHILVPGAPELKELREPIEAFKVKGETDVD